MRRLVILGAGGHGRELLDIVEAVNLVDRRYDFAGFLDDGAPDGRLLLARGVGVIGSTDLLSDLEAEYLIGTGLIAARQRLASLGARVGRTAACLVHPTASIGSQAQLAEGVVLAAGARVTTAVSLGEHVFLNVNATVSHDCELGARTILNPGATVCGNVRVGEDVMLGAGCVIRQGVSVGDAAVVAAGAVVVHDVEANTVVMGVPARAVHPKSR